MIDRNTPASAPPECFIVTVNHEEQYAIWPAGKQIPQQWREVGIGGTKEECLAYIRRVWTDLRPLSVRTHHGPPGTEE